MDMVLRHSASRPRLLMALCLAVLASLSALYLWRAAAGSAAGLIGALCTPSANSGFMPRLGLWLAMTLAMMIPSALPMIATYLDIAEAAAAKRMSVAPPFLLVAGYGAVWVSFAAAAAAGQWVLLKAGYADAVPGKWAGLVLIGAGAYQFTRLKHACLAKCRMPMPYFLSHWSERPLGVLSMGIEQGINCFGCCWALMSLSFITGLMNIAWMGGIGMVMVLEKTLPEPKALSQGLGLGLIGAGLYVVLI